MAPISSYYRKILNNDPLRTLAARHMVLFVENPEWHLECARLHHCDGAVVLVDPNVPSPTVEYLEKENLPVAAVPRDSDDAEIRALLDRLVERVNRARGHAE